MSGPIDPTWWDLADAVAAGRADDEQWRQVNALITADDDAAEFFSDYLDLHAAMSWRRRTVRGGGSVPFMNTTTSTDLHTTAGSARRMRIRYFAAALAAAAVIALVATAAMHWLAPAASTRNGDAAPGQVAMLSDLSDGTLAAAADQPVYVGENLPAGPLTLDAGSAQVMFNCGAVVNLTGPCAFDMTGERRGSLRSGMVRAYVPHTARGFAIDAPGGLRVTDLGTAFEMRLEAADAAAGETTKAKRRLSVWVTQGVVLLERRDPATGRVVLSSSITAGHGRIIGVDPRQPMRPVTALTVINPSFELNTAGQTIGPAVKYVPVTGLAGWSAASTKDDASTLVSQMRGSDQIATIADNFPQGGAAGDRVCQINAYPGGRPGMITQTIDGRFEPGVEYELIVAIGRRLDHESLNIPMTGWRISLNHASDGAIAGGGAAVLDGAITAADTGRMTDRVLRFVATPADANQRIAIRLSQRGAVRAFTAVDFDDVRLRVVGAADTTTATTNNPSDH